MANETIVTVRGWCAGTPVTFDQIDDDAVTRPNATIIRLGVTASYYSRQQGAFMQGETAWYSVRTYGTLATNVASCVRRGTPLLVRGRLVPRRYSNKDGVEMIEQTIIADSVAVDLNTGIANYTKVSAQPLEPLEGERGYEDSVDSYEVDDVTGAEAALSSEDDAGEDPAGVLVGTAM